LDLYADLGVAPDATPADITRAYRRAVKKAHPDHGGDPAAFRKLATARLVLSDPKRRAKYDQTGEVDAEADHSAQNILGAIAQALDAALQMVVQGQADAGAVNVLDQMRAHIARNIAQGKQNRDAGAAMIARLEQAKGRFSVSAGKPNQIEAMIAGRLTDLRRTLATADAQLAILQAALDTLKAYSYRVNQPSGMNFYPLGASVFRSSASTSGW
jgi:curved DNA-binding protein CbpA